MRAGTTALSPGSGKTGLQETQAALRLKELVGLDTLSAGEAAQWRVAKDAGRGCPGAAALKRHFLLNHMSHLSPFSLVPKLSLRVQQLLPNTLITTEGL